MAEPNNPAGRLLALLRAFTAGNPQGRSADVLFNIFGLAPVEWSLLHIRLASFAKLVDATVLAVRSDPTMPPELYLRWESEVRQVVGLGNLEAQWRLATTHLGSEVIQSLEFCDHHLSQNHPELTISEDDRSELRSQAVDLLEEVRASTLPAGLRSFLVATLEAVVEAIDSYRFGGAEPLRMAFSQAVGAAELLDDETKAAGEHEPLVKKTSGLLGSVALLLSIGSSGLELATSVLALTQGHH